jgi:hypothetical protein
MQIQTESPITRKGRIGEVTAWIIAAIAWGISLTSQVGLALDHGFHGWRNVEAVGDGLLPDLAALAMGALALDQADRGRSAKLTWGLSILAGVFMEWANIAYAWPDPEAVILHSFPPFLVVATLYVLVHTRRTNASPARVQVFDQQPAPVPSAPVPDSLAGTSESVLPAAHESRSLPAAHSTVSTSASNLSDQPASETKPPVEARPRAPRSTAKGGARKRTRGNARERTPRLSRDQVRDLVATARLHVLTNSPDDGEPTPAAVAREMAESGHAISDSRARAYLAELKAGDDLARRPRTATTPDTEAAPTAASSPAKEA